MIVIKNSVLLHENDNVVTVIRDITAGEEVCYEKGGAVKKVTATESIPLGHKVALSEIREGIKVIKYDAVIGCAKKDIKVGDLVHVNNLESIRGRGDLNTSN
ncbi:UxaA family hydrolase [Desulfosporosinus burensis]|uniref:UxaA family hydrolase n=1 Tax=Desulfosporosinus sp. BICA1-9 TaxID=1531958 RepID=UPI00061E595F|nr:UxaA family hydrolase [Desulfosporosinus sp. BICA1-9]KJS48741.1 MAG: hypothetical protein VR66_12385 [Peptococcaceae bacterium BRH_c23]